MKKGNQVVYGIFKTRADLERTIDALKIADFRSADVSVLMSATGEEQTFLHTNETKAPEGAATGAGLGATLGGAFGWLVGVGAITVAAPFGAMLAAGPILSALAAAGAGGIVGGIAGGLAGLGFPEYEAQRYEGIVKNGGILLSVHADDDLWESKAKAILLQFGATDVSSSTEAKASSIQASPEAS